jgi:serine/threonine-protein kinase
VLYEMLVGEPPFSGVSATAIMSRHAMEAPPGIGVVRPSVPESVEAAYFAAMQKVPADRPKTATEFAELMKDAKATLGAVARPTGRVPGVSTPTAAAPALVPWYKQPVMAALLVVALAGGGFALWKTMAGKGPAVSGQEARRLAVLYFDNASGQKELDYLADGLTESVIASLSTVPSLYVVSRGGSELFRGSDASTDSIAKALDVGVLVRGSMATEGDNLSVSVRLVDGASGADLSRASVSYPAANPLMLRDSVSARVAELIREQLGTEIRLRDQRDATRNEQAWTVVQRAEAARKRGEKALAGGDREGGFAEFATTDSLLVAASALDDRWPDPLALRGALAYRRARITVADPAVAATWIDSGMVHAEAAIQRSAISADAYEARGNLQYLKAIAGLEPDGKKVDQLIASAKADFEKATSLNPAQAGAWATLSHLYYRVGSTLDVNSAARKAYEADAFLSNADVVLQRLFLSSYDLGDFTPKAESYCAQLNKRFGQSMYAARCQLLLMTTKAKAPDPAKAWLLADSAVMRVAEPQRPYQRLASDMVVAAVLARAGQSDSARRVIRRSEGDPGIDPTRDLVLYGAFAYTLMGDTTEAVGALKRYFASNEARRAAYREDTGWWFRPLAGNLGYQKLVGSMP